MMREQVTLIVRMSTATDQINMFGEKNKFISNINVDQIQKCDETNSSDNNAECINNSSISSIPLRLLAMIIKLAMS